MNDIDSHITPQHRDRIVQNIIKTIKILKYVHYRNEDFNCFNNILYNVYGSSGTDLPRVRVSATSN
jgi:hypothetical protein